MSLENRLTCVSAPSEYLTAEFIRSDENADACSENGFAAGRVYRSMIRICWILLVVSSPFLLLSTYVVFVLSGSLDELAFSVVHAQPGPLLILLYASFVCYFVFLLYGFVVVTSTFVTRGWPLLRRADAEFEVSIVSRMRFMQLLSVPPLQSWSVIVYVGTVLLLIHFCLIFSYGR
jgi:hypothetical protein